MQRLAKPRQVRRVVSIRHRHHRALAVTHERECAVHLGSRARKEEGDLVVDRIRVEVDELLTLLCSEQADKLTLGQPMLEQHFAEPPATVRGLREGAVDGLERQQPRAHNEGAEWIAPHLGRAVRRDRRRCRRRTRFEHAHAAGSPEKESSGEQGASTPERANWFLSDCPLQLSAAAAPLAVPLRGRTGLARAAS